jgi:hypothetical protein
MRQAVVQFFVSATTSDTETQRHRENLTQSRTANGHEYTRIKAEKNKTKIAAKEHKERKKESAA